jgi:cytolysin (calcineurin-like family phosphatase)
MDADFIRERIAATKVAIVAYEDAIMALCSSDGVQSYSLNTGQTQQSVTRFDIANLGRALDGLYNRLATLEARLNGATIVARPHW